ncbi:(+)-delta-cadinene synthase isozyme XC14-like [Gossypium australe]|uniref:(+)-delta-cadinene synthase isozyme XC14-like n=1 Tax=Gossypium australe TaxID=47621 RepID=A0A5B6VTF2_9ROSI|nr:(+)-delta-cadinene synthase isozyme XC14-like [Gossypium australe]
MTYMTHMAHFKNFNSSRMQFRDQLPEYMKSFYKPLLDLFGEKEQTTINLNNCVNAKWYNENFVPSMEEYMRNANPKTTDASSVVGRLMNDVTSHKFEQERGHCAPAVECYMREHAVSEEEACSELKKQVENAWKDINQEMILSEISKVVPRPVLTRVLNFTRFIDFIYKIGDEYTHVGKNTKDGITVLLIDPISISY